MPEPPRRKRFQIHLSTAVVMMFVAGALIWANTRQRTFVETVNRFDQPGLTEQTSYGWPIFAYRVHGYMGWGTNRHPLGPQFKSVAAAFDALIALLILASVWFLCEWLIRRRAARKEQ